VFIWDALTGEVKCKKRLPKGSRLVTAIGISATDKYVCASDAAEKITAHVFDVEGGINPIQSISINMKIVHLAWSPVVENMFATSGKDHVAICTVEKDKITKKMGSSKGGKMQSHCSVAWANDDANKNVFFSGG